MRSNQGTAASGDEPTAGDGLQQLIHNALDAYEARKPRKPVPEWMKLKEAAQYLRLDPVTLCRLITKEGTGPESFRIGANSRRISRTACDRWIQAGGVLGTEAGRKQAAARATAKAAHSDAEV